jgi:hypothetical protein
VWEQHASLGSLVKDQGVRYAPYLFENVTLLMVVADALTPRRPVNNLTPRTSMTLRTTTRSMQIATRVGSSTFSPMRPNCQPLASLRLSAPRPSCCRRSSVPEMEGNGLSLRRCAHAPTSLIVTAIILREPAESKRPCGKLWHDGWKAVSDNAENVGR